MKNSNAKAAFLELLQDPEVKLKIRMIYGALYQREALAGTVLPSLVGNYSPEEAAEKALEYADALMDKFGIRE